ncbi:bifunctional riboflavin kinase/FAD synthetase [Desulfovibrio sp. OttesenSCG-928-F07]|nr:bifunctional riboflavin kinase/FAD synthetase [Desulfovibrio sp. OttesenSCG-928-F07]
MITLFSLQDAAKKINSGSAVSWGNFDGVHLGHQSLLSGLRNKAKALGVPAVVITFDPHPALFFSNGTKRHSITDTSDKLTLLSNLGIDYTLVLPFNDAFARQTPQEFTQNILVNTLKAKIVELGHDLGFGKNRAGGFEELIALSHKFNFKVEQNQAVQVENSNDPVCSTLVRKAITEGNMQLATTLLGRVHSIHAGVRHGFKRGQGLLGFPTANIDPGPLLLPPHGVYACLARLENKFYAAATNLGINPSFGGETPSLEAHMLDFDGDLYGRDLRLYFLEFLRPEQKFDSVEALKEQIGRDVEKTRLITAKARNSSEFSTLFPL